MSWTDPWWKNSTGKYGIVVIEPRLHPALIFLSIRSMCLDAITLQYG